MRLLSCWLWLAILAALMPAPIAQGVVFALWHIDGREGPRAQEARPSDGVTTVGVAPSARLCRPQGRGHDPARLACVTHGAREPIPARAGFVDNDEVLTFRLPRTDAVIAVTLTRAPGPEIGDLSPVLVSDRRHRAGCCMDLSTAVEGVEGVSGLTSEPDSGAGLRRLWPLGGEPASAPEVSLPLGSHDV